MDLRSGNDGSDFHPERERMVERDIAARGVSDPAVLAAMRQVPRHLFVADALKAFAYEDRPLSIGGGQTISQPYTVAMTLEAAELHPDARVLEIGAGSGYAAAVLSRIVAEVVAVERDKALAREAQRRLQDLGYANATIIQADGSGGWPEGAPYDVIIVSAGAPAVPAPLWEQLVAGGRVVIPVGRSLDHQWLMRLRKTDTGYDEENLGAFAFVPLVGSHGW